MKTATPSVLAIALGLVVVGCGHEGTPATSTAPTSAASPAPSGFGTVRIVSGPDGTPVVGASVTFEGDDEAPALSGPSGEASPADWMLATYGRAIGTAVDVDARGFLPRRTRVGYDRVVTLWPAADDGEADAVRRMVYGDRQVRPPFDLSPILITVPEEGPDFWSSAVGRAWQAQALAFGARFGLEYAWSSSLEYMVNEMAVRFETSGACVPELAAGFCREQTPYPPDFLEFVVRPERAGDPATIRRVLASVFLGPNPLPGLLNPDAPAEELSPLEEQTIRMVLLRRLPNRWPDTDR